MAEKRSEKVADGAGGSKFSYDDILGLVGSFGPYQKTIFFCVLIPAILPSGFLSMTSVFLAATPSKFWCTLPESRVSINSTISNWTTAQWQADRSDNKNCELCHLPRSTDVYGSNGSVYYENICNATDVVRTTCSEGVDFIDDVYESTAVTEWDLVCDKKYQATLTFAFFTAGGICGPLLWGFLADRIGRKNGFFCCVLFQSIFAIATFWAPSYVLFCLFRFCVGMTTSSGYVIPFVLALEIVGRSQRAFISVCCSFCYSIGCLIFLGIAYNIRSWRYFALTSSLLAAALYGSVWCFFPESPRWLLSRGKYAELEKFIRSVSKRNGRKLSPETDVALPELIKAMDRNDHTKKHTILDLFRSHNLRKKTLILILLNCCNKGVSLGLNFYAPLFSPNPHLAALLNTLVELPPYLFAQRMFDRLGRRSSLFCGLTFGAVACLGAFGVSMIFGDSAQTWILVLSLLAKFAITFTYLNGKLLEDETFPTVVRGEGHSLVSVISSAVTCGVPFVVDLGHSFKVLPLSIFGSLCLISSFTVFFLPETAHQKLPQTLEEGEQFGANVPLREKFRFFPQPSVDMTDVPVEASEMQRLKTDVVA